MLAQAHAQLGEFVVARQQLDEALRAAQLQPEGSRARGLIEQTGRAVREILERRAG